MQPSLGFINYFCLLPTTLFLISYSFFFLSLEIPTGQDYFGLRFIVLRIYYFNSIHGALLLYLPFQLNLIS